MSNDVELREQARRKVASRSAYKGVMFIWSVVAIGLIGIWYATTPYDYFWPMWPILTMVVASAIWGLSVYGRGPFQVKEAEVEKEFQKLRQQPR